MMKMLYATVVAATLVACATVKPAPIQVGDRCLRCRVPVGDLRVAGEIVANDAWFVPAQLVAPEGKQRQADYLAFRSRSDAEAARAGQPLLRWAQVVAEAAAN